MKNPIFLMKPRADSLFIPSDVEEPDATLAYLGITTPSEKVDSSGPDQLSVIWETAKKHYLSKSLSKSQRAMMEDSPTAEDLISMIQKDWLRFGPFDNSSDVTLKTQLSDETLLELQSTAQKESLSGNTVALVASCFCDRLDIIARYPLIGVNVLWGAFILVFTVARDHMEAYEMITYQLMDILLIFNRLQLHAGPISSGLQKIYLFILVEILNFSGIVVQMLKRKAWSMFPVGNADQETFLLDLIRKDTRLFRFRQRLAELVRHENLQLSSEIHQNVTRLGKDMGVVQARVESVHDAVSLIHSEVGDVSSTLNRIESFSSEMALSMCALHDRFPQIPESGIGKLRNWLSVHDDVVNDYSTFRVSRFAGTCEWFLENPLYRAWHSKPSSSLFWIHGLPGSGKSVLSSYLVETEIANCIYFFFRFDDANKRQPQALLRSAAFQLAEQYESIHDALCKLCDQGLDLDRLQLGSLWQKIFAETILKVPVTFYWFIDGLDECATDRDLLVRLLGEAMKTQSTIKIILVSRFSNDIAKEIRLLGAPVYEITPDDNTRDIARYVNTRMEGLLSVEHRDTQDELVSEISGRAHGGFLWTRLVLDRLEAEHSIEGMRTALHEMPDKLVTVYERIVESNVSILNPSQRSLAKAIFMYVIVAARPLSLNEIAYVLQSQFGSLRSIKATIRDICGSMIRFGPQDTIHTIHMTVQQYLVACGGEFQINIPIADVSVAIRCLEYLLTDLPDPFQAHSGDLHGQRQALQNRHSFLDYAAIHWATHLSTASADKQVFSLISQFIANPNILKWLQYLALAGKFDVLRVVADNLEHYLDQTEESSTTEREWILDVRRLASILGHSEENYKGERVNGRKEGFGEMLYSDGSRYIGQWEKDRENGKGKKIIGNKVYEGEFLDGLEHGKGISRVTLVGGSFMEYVGDYAFGRQHGWGKETAGSGVVSEGNFKEGQQDGMGTQNLPPGNFYRGNFKDSREHGYGESTFIDGASYRSEFSKGAFHGQGIYDDGEGNVYEGSWEDGEKNGYGVLTVKDGRKFEGIWSDGLLPTAPQIVVDVARATCKHGLLRYKNGDTWEGERKYSRPHGQGTYTYAINGCSFSGSFSYGRFHGHIVETHPIMGKYAEGDYKDGRLYGYGWQSFPGGSYRGEYVARHYEGKGILETSEQTYKGEWKANKRCGKGKAVYKNGQTYDGEWLNDVKHGLGIFQFGKGITCSGNWMHGRMNVPSTLSFSRAWANGWPLGIIRSTS